MLLAKKGCEVTHFDISQSMLDKAKELAAKEGVLDKMTFVNGALEDLKDFHDKAFEFILDENCDDPFVKWCIDHKESTIETFHFSKDAAMKLYKDGLMGGDSEIAEYENGGTPWCITYTFMPDELEDILKHCGVKNIKLAGSGAYARTLPRELLVKIMNDSEQRSDFLDFCHYYDANPFVCGMGKDNLFAQGEL